MPPRRTPATRANPPTEDPDVPDDTDGEHQSPTTVGDVRAIEGLDARVELPFLQLPDGGDGGNNSPPSNIPAFMLVATAIPACTLSQNVADRSAFAVATTILTTLKDAALARIFDTLRGLGVLSTRDAPLTWGGFIRGLSAARRKATAEQLSSLTITAADLQSNEPFDRPAKAAQPARSGRPAVAATPAQQGPEALLLLRVAHWLHFSKESEMDLPLLDLALLYMLLGDTSTFDARMDAAAQCRLAADQISALVSLRCAAPGAATHHLAQLLPACLRSVRLPIELFSPGADPKEALLDLVEGHRYACASEAEQKRIEQQRLMSLARELDASDVSRILHHADASGRISIFEELSAIYLGHHRSLQLPSLRMRDLDRKLREVRFIVEPALADGLSPKDLTELLRAEGDAHASCATFRRSTDAADSKGSLAPSFDAQLDPMDEAVKRELRSQEFLEAKGKLLSLPVEDGTQHIHILAIAYTANVPVITRYLHQPTESLRRRDDVFTILSKCLYARRAYFSFGQVIALCTPDTESPSQARFSDMPSHMHDYLWDEESYSSWNAGKGAEIKWNDDAVRLKAKSVVNKLALTPPKHQWRVISVLECTRDFMAAQYAADGYPSSVTTGYTVRALFDFYITFIRWATDLGDAESEHALTVGERAIKNQLILMDEDRRASYLITATSSTLSKRGAVAPFGCSLELTLNSFRQDAAGLVGLRRTFPHLMPSSTVKFLPGVPAGGEMRVTDERSYAKAAEHAKPPKLAQAKPGKGAGKMTPAKRKPGELQGAAAIDGTMADLPGSKAALAKMLESGAGLFLSGRVYDIPAIAKAHSMETSGPCWPCLLSKKVGAARLALCPTPSQPGHETVSSSAHARPGGWDLAKIGTDFSRKATAAECKLCNYNVPEVNGSKKPKK